MKTNMAKVAKLHVLMLSLKLASETRVISPGVRIATRNPKVISIISLTVRFPSLRSPAKNWCIVFGAKYALIIRKRIVIGGLASIVHKPR